MIVFRWLLPFLLALSMGLAHAQAATGSLSFTPPTQYENGAPLPASAITGYDVQCSAWTPAGGARGACTIFASVALAGNATGGTVTGTVPASGGVACWQIRTKVGAVPSAWSPEACKTFAAVLPNPPSNVTVAQVSGVPVSVVFKITANGSRSATVAGFVPAGRPCTGPVVFSYRAQAYREVAWADVRAWNTTASGRVAGPCG